MAVKFIIKTAPDSVLLSLPGMDFEKTVQVTLTGEISHLADDLDIMKHLTYALHRETQRRMPVKYLLIKLFDQFDYFIESESDFSPAYLERFALILQLHLRLRRLVVNDRDLATPLWRRNLEYWLRLMAVDVIPLSAMVLSVYFMPPFFRTNPLFFLIFLFLVLYALRFLGKGLWMLASRALVSKGYLDGLLGARRGGIGLFDKFWLRLVWGKQ